MALISLNERLEEASGKLNIALREAEQHTREAIKLAELVDILQSCQSVEEAYRIAKASLPSLLPSKSGALCITSTSRSIVEAVASWGDTASTEKAFVPDSCSGVAAWQGSYCERRHIRLALRPHRRNQHGRVRMCSPGGTR